MSENQSTIDPETGFNIVLAQQMARDIELADQINPNSWTVISAGGQPFLNVANLNVISIAGPSTSYSFLISMESISEQARSAAQSYFDANRTYATRAWAQNLRLDDAAVTDHAAALENAHLEAVKQLAGETKSRANRWKEHRPNFLEQLGRAIGRQLPEPGYAAELLTLNAQPATHDASDAPLPDKGGPASAISNPTPESAKQMAHTILAAHDISPNCWAVYASNNRIVVMVGNVAAGGSRQVGKYDTLMLRDALDIDIADRLAATPVPKIPKDYPTLIFPQVPDTTSESEFLSWQAAHEAALSVVTNPYKKAVLWQSHREDLAQRIATIADIEIPEPAYLPLPPPPPPPHPPVSLKIVRELFAATGLSYTEHQVATFVTALQTKGFVVLSGISGTGKSKIATGFVQMLPAAPYSTDDLDLELDMDQPIRVANYMIKQGRMVVPKRFHNFLKEFDPKVSHELPVIVDNIRGVGKLRKRPDRNTWTVVLPESAIELSATWQVGQPIYPEFHMSTDLNHVEEIELSTTQKRSQNQDIPVANTASKNHLFLSVRPDWRDSTSLLGYYNPLTKTYEWTEFLKFVLQAVENFKGPEADRIAWFVILDEMNLAHVEYYFADLLSVLESGRTDEGWTTQPLRTTYPDLIADDDVPEHEILLPPNLYIIGTVNMDETTHAFSPKVLDRAFTIELTDVNLGTYAPKYPKSGSSGLNDVQRRALLNEFSRHGRFHRIDKEEIDSVISDNRHPEIRRHLHNLNVELHSVRFHFGYRVFDEIAQYLAVNDETGLMTFQEAFDWAVFMKVLPKFTGSLARLRSPLTSLLVWAIDPEQQNKSETTNLLQSHLANPGQELVARINSAPYRITAKRALQMLETLYTDGFVSFG